MQGATAVSSDFVRSSPDIETIDPHIDELLPQIIDFWEKKGRESPKTEGTGRAVRGAHAKSIGVVKAEVDIRNDAPAACSQGTYAKPGRHGALIRFSSASSHPGPEVQLGPVLRFAIKIFDVPYAASAKVRRTLNGQPQTKPTSASAVLP